jgi:hypothetical protein
MAMIRTQRYGGSGHGRRYRQHQPGPVYGTFNGGILTIGFSQISGNTAFGQGGGIFEATITSSGPAAGGPLTIKFSQDLVPAVARAVMNA